LTTLINIMHATTRFFKEITSLFGSIYMHMFKLYACFEEIAAIDHAQTEILKFQLTNKMVSIVFPKILM